ncbi:lipid-binding protein [Batrachochytrium dendrobatidis]|nr:lipid-binding protein [Batrachochytrium dendrobatidis]
MAFQGIRRGLVSMNAVDPLLANLLHEEKDVLKGLANFAKEKGEASKFLALWGNVEHADIKDICDRVRDMFEELQNMLVALSTGYSIYRDKLKDINKGAEDLHVQQQKLRSCQDKLAHAIKSKKPHEHLQVEVAVVEKEVLEMVAGFESSKRALLKEGLESQFESFQCFGKQLVILGTFGKHMTSQIPQGKLAAGQELPLYKGNETTKRVFSDFTKELNDVRSKKPVVKRNSTLGSISETANKPYTAPLAMAQLDTRPRVTANDGLLSRSSSPLPLHNRKASIQSIGQPTNLNDGMKPTQAISSQSNGFWPRDANVPQTNDLYSQQQHFQKYSSSQALYQTGQYQNGYQQFPPNQQQSWMNSTQQAHTFDDFSTNAQPLSSNGNCELSRSLPMQHMSGFPCQNEPSEINKGNSFHPDSLQHGRARGYSQTSIGHVSGISGNTASVNYSAPQLSSSTTNPQYEPTTVEFYRCVACGRGVTGSRMGDHRASGCVTHIVAP